MTIRSQPHRLDWTSGAPDVHTLDQQLATQTVRVDEMFQILFEDLGSLVTAAGLPSTGAQPLTSVDDTNITLTLAGTPATALLQSVSITAGWAGQLGLSRGGTNADLSATGGAGQFLQQASVGAAVTVAQPSHSQLSSLNWAAAGHTFDAALDTSAQNILTTGDLGLTGSRVSHGWLIDLTVTNAIAGNITGTATNLSGTPALPNGTTATTQAAADNSTKLATTAYADAAAAAGTTVITDDVATNATMYPTWVTTNTGGLPLKVSSTKLSFNPSTGLLTSTGFSGPLTGNATTATTLATPRAIYGNNFDGSAALTQIIASTYGGTGNGFAKFSGPTTGEKTFTLPDSSQTLAYHAEDLSVFAATSSAQLAGVLSDETGSSGGFVRAGSPTITTPVITQIVPGADFSISQNSVTPFVSVNAGAIASTLYIHAGSVGIAAPPDTAFALDVAGGARSNYFYVGTAPGSPRPFWVQDTSTADTATYINTDATFGATVINVQTAIAAGSGFYLLKALTDRGGAGPIQFSVRGDGQVYVAGNVGIGTTGPGGPLHINAPSGDASVRLSNNGTVGSIWGMASATNNGINGTASGDSYIRAENASLFFSRNAGTSYQLALDSNDVVAQENNAKTDTTERRTFRLKTNEADASNPFDLKVSLTGAAALANRYVLFQTSDHGSANGGNIVFQEYGGNVGIGTTGPGAQLHTTGTVRFANFGAGAATFDASGNISSVSDGRLKIIVGPLLYGLQEIRQLVPIIYKWPPESKMDTIHDYPGFDACVVAAFMPLAAPVHPTQKIDAKGQVFDSSLTENFGREGSPVHSFDDRAVVGALVNAVVQIDDHTHAQQKQIVDILKRLGQLEAR